MIDEEDSVRKKIIEILEDFDTFRESPMDVFVNDILNIIKDEITDTKSRCFRETYRMFIKNQNNMTFFETWLIENS